MDRGEAGEAFAIGVIGKEGEVRGYQYCRVFYYSGIGSGEF